LLSYGLVIRPLRHASTLTKGIATLAVLVILQSATTLRYGSTPQTVRAFLPAGSFHVLGIAVQSGNVIVFGACLLLVVGLTVVYRRTRFGMATTAVAEGEFKVALLGRSSSLIAAVNWTIGCGLAGLAGVNIAPLSSIYPAQSSVLLMPALAVALCGQFTSFAITFGGALLIGIGQAELGLYSTSSFLSNLPGLSEALPFIVIVVIVAFRSKALPGRDFVASVLPRVGTGIMPLTALAVWAALGLILVGCLSGNWVIALTTGMIYGIMLLSLVVVTGYAGQLSLAQVAIAGVSVLVASLLVAKYAWPMPLAALAGIGVTIPVAFIIGLPALRTRGIMLGVVTLGLADALNAMLFQRVDVNGQGGGINVGAARFFGISLDQTTNPRAYALFSLVILAVVVLMVSNLRRSSIGKMLLAVRGNERAAAALGINVTAAKLYAFVVSGALAGIAGILAAWEVPNILLNVGYDPFQSVNAVVSATLAGVGYISAGILGGALTTPGGISGQLITDIGLGQYLTLVTGGLLLLNIVFNPNGIVPNTIAMVRSGWSRATALRALGGRVPGWVPGRSLRGGPGRDRSIGGALDAGPDGTVWTSRHAGVLLEIRDLQVVFGTTQAVAGVSLDCRGGEVVGILGPNGSGKTTLIDAITGYVPATGTVRLNGVPIDKLPAYQRSRNGISRSFQSLELFGELSVADNLLVAAGRDSWATWVTSLIWPGRPRANDAVRAAVREFGLSDELGRGTNELPYGQRRLLAICRALSTSPRVLLLDEPAAGLGDSDRDELRRLVRQVATDWGLAVVLIEHDVELVMDVADRVIVLESGTKIAEGLPADVRVHPEVVRSYLGALEESEHIADSPELIEGTA
jgi:sulfate-transporting ATPase